jgi:UDP-glucose 4-epimerase
MKKILITGKSGYIATELKKYLSTKYEVTAIGREDFSLESAVETDKFFNKSFYDVVIHSAIVGGGRMYPDDINCLKSNINIFLNILNNKKKFGKLLNFGSGAQFTLQPKYYGLSKKLINNFIHETKNFYDLRIYGVFDENEPESKFIKRCINSNLAKEKISIFNNKMMDYIFMPDLCSLVEYYIKGKNLKKEIDCCYKDKVTLFNVAKFINSISDFESEIKVESHSYDHYIGSKIDLPIKILGLQEGIKKTFENIKNNVV